MYKNLLLPIDVSDPSTWRRPLATALEYCKHFQSALHIMTVVPGAGLPMVASFFPEDFEKQMVEKARRELDAFRSQHIPAAVDSHTVVAAGSVYEEIIRIADAIDSDLIIMGRSSDSHSHFLLGPNAERVIRHTERSVLVVS